MGASAGMMSDRGRHEEQPAGEVQGGLENLCGVKSFGEPSNCFEVDNRQE